jgi:hypothetical protein
MEGVTAWRGGIMVETKGMNQILELDEKILQLLFRQESPSGNSMNSWPDMAYGCPTNPNQKGV